MMAHGLLAGVDGNKIVFWDAHSYCLIDAVAVVEDVLQSFSFSPDGTKFGVVLENAINLYDLTNLRNANIVEPNNYFEANIVDVEFINSALFEFVSAIFSSDSNHLLIMQAGDGNSLSFADLVNKTILWSSQDKFRSFLDPVISSDDRFIFMISRIGNYETMEHLSTIDAQTGKSVSLNAINNGSTNQIALSRDQQTFAACGNVVLLWDVDRRQGCAKLSLRGELRDDELREDGNVIRCLAFIEDGSNRIITGSHDFHLKIWNVITCEELHRIPFDLPPFDISYCLALNHVACLSFNGIEIFDCGNYSCVTAMRSVDFAVGGRIAYSPAQTVVLL